MNFVNAGGYRGVGHGFHFAGGRTLSWGVREDVNFIQFNGLQERQGGGKMGVGFGRKTNNQIRTDDGVRKSSTQTCHNGGIFLRGIMAVHIP